MAQYRKDTNVYLSQEKTIFEVVKLSDRITPSGTATDAFGRLRISNPFTLFDSQNRYIINDRFNTSNTGSANANTIYYSSQSALDLNVGTPASDSVIRESKRVFAYQPGKSLLIMNTFVMANAQNNLTQRVGYFGNDNGVFLEKSNNNIYLVLRSNSTGSISETKVAQADWNKDVFDGSENSYATAVGHGGLDTTKSNIFWIDIEWLGVGDVRCGFVVDGLMVPTHVFHNDNLRTVPYMTTACLPIRYEIFNTGITANNSTLKQICSTVISEGGYELRGRPRTAGHAVNSAVTLTTAGVDYTVASIRLKSERADAIVIPKQISILGITTNPTRLKYKIMSDANTVGGTWVSAGTDSSVQYNLGTSIGNSSGTELKSGYIGVTNQSAGTVSLDSELFKLQLERNSFTNTNTTFNIVVSGATNGDQCIAAIDWEEIV
jgi:hypothetical protein